MKAAKYASDVPPFRQGSNAFIELELSAKQEAAENFIQVAHCDFGHCINRIALHPE
jgi:hypothetical protein